MVRCSPPFLHSSSKTSKTATANTRRLHPPPSTHAINIQVKSYTTHKQIYMLTRPRRQQRMPGPGVSRCAATGLEFWVNDTGLPRMFRNVEGESDTPRSRCAGKVHLSRRLDAACLLKAAPRLQDCRIFFFSKSSLVCWPHLLSDWIISATLPALRP